MRTNTVKWQLLMCALLLIICLLVISLVVILLADSIGINMSLPVSITLVFVGLVVLAIVLAVYLVHKWANRKSMDLTTANTNDNISHISETNKEVKDDNFMSEEDEDTIEVRGVEIIPNPAQGTVGCGNLEWQVLVCALFVFFCLLTTSVVVIVLDHYLGTDIALPVSITLILVGVMVLPTSLIVYFVLKWTRYNKHPKETDIHTFEYFCANDEVSIKTESGHSTCQGNEEDKIAARRVETTAIILNPGYGTVTCKPTTPDMVDKYDCELPELNEQGICDNPPQSTHPKMTNTHDNVYGSAIIEPSREVECDYPTDVGSGEDKMTAIRVEMILNPAYETVTCKSTTPDMVDEYDCELPELNKERKCDNPSQSTDSNMTDTCDNVYDPSIIAPNREVGYKYPTEAVVKIKDISYNAREPNTEVIYDYPTGVRSEDEIAARRVEMIPNPAYETVTCESTTPDMVDKYDCELPELNEERICDHPNAGNEYVTERVGMTANSAYESTTPYMMNQTNMNFLNSVH